MYCIYSIVKAKLVQGEEGLNPSIKLENTHQKGGKIMNNKINNISFSLKFTIELTTIFNLVNFDNFLV